MGSCIIFCAAGFDSLLRPITKEDYIIAADGGYAHVEQLGLTPDHILGDFDSLGRVPEAAAVFPVEKDDTDAMLAVRHGLEKGFTRFFLYGSLDGPRLDHTVANFQTLQYLKNRGATGYLVGKHHIVTLIQQETLTFPPEAKGLLSLFCLGSPAGGVTLNGLKYNLENGTLTPDFPLGVSNQFIGQAASVTVQSGSLLAIFDRSSCLPVENLP